MQCHLQQHGPSCQGGRPETRQPRLKAERRRLEIGGRRAKERAEAEWGKAEGSGLKTDDLGSAFVLRVGGNGDSVQ